jgi:hypothetical protein
MIEQNAGMDDDASAIKARLQAEVARSNVAPDTVRELVCALVDRMKGDGEPPEKVVVAVKSALLGEPGEPRRVAYDLDARAEAETLLRQALSWCIQQYYRE